MSEDNHIAESSTESLPRQKKRRARRSSQAASAVAAVIAASATPGLSNRSIARTTGMTHPTVAAILARNPDAVAEAKQHLRTRYLAIADEAADRISGHLDEVSPAQAAVIGGIAIQRSCSELDPTSQHPQNQTNIQLNITGQPTTANTGNQAKPVTELDAQTVTTSDDGKTTETRDATASDSYATNATADERQTNGDNERLNANAAPALSKLAAMTALLLRSGADNA